MITTGQLEQMRSAFNGLSGRLALQKKMTEIALERLEEAERIRDELEAACAALAVAIKSAEEAQKQEPASGKPSTDSRCSSRSMAVELAASVADNGAGCKRPKTKAKQKEARP